MNTVTAPRRRTRQARSRSEDGFITVQVLGLVLLVLGTMLLIVGSAASSRNVAREGREFTDTGRGTDQANARLLYYFNLSAANAPFGSGGASSLAGWALSPVPSGTDQTVWSTDAINRTLVVTSTSDDTKRTVTTPIRGKLVASYRDTADGKAIGVPAGPAVAGRPADALGVWGSAVSTTKDTIAWGSPFGSEVAGGVYGNETKTVPGQWDVYGGTVGNAGGANVVSYSNDVAPPTTPGVGGTFDRSQVNAYLDEKQHDKLMSNVSTNTASCNGASGKGTLLNAANLNSSPSTYFCAKGDVTLGSITRTTAGVTTIVVKGGNLFLTGNISTGTAGELHIYVDGQVQLTGTAQNINRAYFFAPNHQCASAGTSNVVNVVGSVACTRVALSATGSSVAWVRPRDQPTSLPYTYGTGDARNAATPTAVYYFEKPGFRDRLTP